MKKISLLAAIILFTLSVSAQIQKPVIWAFSAKKLSGNNYEVHITATIKTGWHIYSQNTPDGGPVPTTISFSKNPLSSLDGKIKEVGKMEQHNEPLFGVDVKQYSNKVDFVQIVKLKGNAKTAITGAVEFMVCNDKQCLPPTTEKFSIDLK